MRKKGTAGEEHETVCATFVSEGFDIDKMSFRYVDDSRCDKWDPYDVLLKYDERTVFCQPKAYVDKSGATEVKFSRDKYFLMIPGFSRVDVLAKLCEARDRGHIQANKQSPPGDTGNS